MKSLIQKLVCNKWTFINSIQSTKLPQEILLRYPHIPSEVVNFVSLFSELSSPDDTSWFLSIDDYCGKSDSEYKWNEFELMSLEAANDDLEWSKEVTAFWDKYFPIYISVENGYEFAAVSLHEKSLGHIVRGYEPEFEDIETVAGSLSAFIDTII